MKTLKKDEVGKKTWGSSNKGHLNITYTQLVSILGEPTYNTPSGDNKVQKEWAVEYKGKTFTIYDWKTYDVDYTMNELNQFNIGGVESAEEFITELESKIGE
jgi:hypothetical protein